MCRLELCLLRISAHDAVFSWAVEPTTAEPPEQPATAPNESITQFGVNFSEMSCSPRVHSQDMGDSLFSKQRRHFFRPLHLRVAKTGLSHLSPTSSSVPIGMPTNESPPLTAMIERRRSSFSSTMRGSFCTQALYFRDWMFPAFGAQGRVQLRRRFTHGEAPAQSVTAHSRNQRCTQGVNERVQR